MDSNGLTKEEMHRVAKVFQLADEKGKQFLNYDDLKVAVMALFGYKPSKGELLEMIQRYGGEGAAWNAGLSKDQFERAVAPKFGALDEDEEIRNTFSAFDSSCRGFLTVEDTKKVFSQVCPRLSDERVESTFKEMDRDGDGRVSYKDFDFMMKFNNFS